VIEVRLSKIGYQVLFRILYNIFVENSVFFLESFIFRKLCESEIKKIHKIKGFLRFFQLSNQLSKSVGQKTKLHKKNEIPF